MGRSVLKRSLRDRALKQDSNYHPDPENAHLRPAASAQLAIEARHPGPRLERSASLEPGLAPAQAQRASNGLALSFEDGRLAAAGRASGIGSRAGGRRHSPSRPAPASVPITPDEPRLHHSPPATDGCYAKARSRRSADHFARIPPAGQAQGRRLTPALTGCSNGVLCMPQHLNQLRPTPTHNGCFASSNAMAPSHWISPKVRRTRAPNPGRAGSR